jgi:hypothetical protein
MYMKRMVVQFLERGIVQAAGVKDLYAVQNGIIYFWNLHVHLFRHNLYAQAIEEVQKFILTIVAALDAMLAETSAAAAAAAAAMDAQQRAQALPAPAPFDHRLRISLLETLASFYESQGKLPEAIDAANRATSASGAGGAGDAAAGAAGKGGGKAAASSAPSSAAVAAGMGVPEYLRKKACEQSSRLQLLQATAGAGAAGGKGGSKGGAEVPMFGNTFLNIFAIIAQAEQPSPAVMPREQAVALVVRAIVLLEKDLEADLAVVDFVALSQERFSQLVEMQVEAWTRLTRLRMLFGDTIGAQYTAEKCLNLVTIEHISTTDESFLSPRVWRWIR